VGPHAIKGTEGVEVIDDIKPTSKDFVVERRRYSAFFETGLDLLLRELGVDTVVLTGLHTNICVKHTAADAFCRGYNIIVLKDFAIMCSRIPNSSLSSLNSNCTGIITS